MKTIEKVRFVATIKTEDNQKLMVRGEHLDKVVYACEHTYGMSTYKVIDNTTGFCVANLFS